MTAKCKQNKDDINGDTKVDKEKSKIPQPYKRTLGTGGTLQVRESWSSPEMSMPSVCLVPKRNLKMREGCLGWIEGRKEEREKFCHYNFKNKYFYKIYVKFLWYKNSNLDFEVYIIPIYLYTFDVDLTYPQTHLFPQKHQLFEWKIISIFLGMNIL